MQMEVVILCGGRGMRMEEFTQKNVCEHREIEVEGKCHLCGVKLEDGCVIGALKTEGKIEALRDVRNGIPMEEIMKRNNIAYLE